MAKVADKTTLTAEETNRVKAKVAGSILKSVEELRQLLADKSETEVLRFWQKLESIVWQTEGAICSEITKYKLTKTNKDEN